MKLFNHVIHLLRRGTSDGPFFEFLLEWKTTTDILAVRRLQNRKVC